MGTGTVVDPAGLILTVNYVVMGGRTIEVTLERGRTQRAEIVAQDFEIGLALLHVKRQGLPAGVASSETLTPRRARLRDRRHRRRASAAWPAAS